MREQGAGKMTTKTTLQKLVRVIVEQVLTPEERALYDERTKPKNGGWNK